MTDLEHIRVENLPGCTRVVVEQQIDPAVLEIAQKQQRRPVEVARQVCEEGRSAHRIAAKLYTAEYGSNTKAKSRSIMRVKHLLRRALETGILTLRKPRADLANALQAGFNGIEFEVVDDGGSGLDPAEPVYREAARVVAERIDDLMREQKRVVIANAGGWALSRLVEYLPAWASSYENAQDRLRFISLNALGSADNYHLSANFIAVRMASIFGGRHLAMLRASSLVNEYRRAVADIDLVVCGIGSRGAFMSKWLREESGASKRIARKIELPASVVGDICLIPVDRTGAQVPLADAAATRIHDELMPQPDYATLKRLADEGKVLVVLATPQTDKSRPPADPVAALKIPIAMAILRQPLTKWCVLGSSLAEELRSVLERDDQVRSHRHVSSLVK